MARPKVDPVERAFDAYTALTFDQSLQFEAMRKGFDKGRGATDIGTAKPARVRKVKAPAEVAGA